MRSIYNQNDIYMLERIEPYYIINDNHQGIIVLDSLWNEVKRIKVDENLFYPEARYIDYVNNRMLFKLEAFLCLVDIESSGVKLIELPDDLQDIYFSNLHCFCKDHIMIDTSKNVVSLDLIDFKITVLELASVDEYPFIFEEQDTIHISLLLNNDWEEIMRVEEYAFTFDELHENVVL